MKTPVLAIEQSVRHLEEDGLIYPGKYMFDIYNLIFYDSCQLFYAK